MARRRHTIGKELGTGIGSVAVHRGGNRAKAYRFDCNVVQ
jgi:hypothetical protein